MASHTAGPPPVLSNPPLSAVNGGQVGGNEQVFCPEWCLLVLTAAISIEPHSLGLLLLVFYYCVVRRGVYSTAVHAD